MGQAVLYVLVPVAAVVVLVVLLRRRGKCRKRRKTAKPATYDGAIRVTDHLGRDMKIIRKEDGSFEMIEEKNEK
jgi:hypothetical protein